MCIRDRPQDTRPQNPGIPAFRTADSNVPEPQDPGASNTDFSQPDTAFSDVSLSVPSEDGPADDEKELTGILDACELSYFEPEAARVFENAIERLFYSDVYKRQIFSCPAFRAAKAARHKTKKRAVAYFIANSA